MSQFNYIGYDLGNFLNEWATQYEEGFEIRADLEVSAELRQRMIEEYFGELGRHYEFPNSPGDLEQYVRVGRMLSHLFWMVVGLKQIDDGRIEFSMVYYIKRRQQELMRHLSGLQ